MILSSGIINLGAFSVAIIDIVVVLYVLVMALLGIKRGFVKMLFKLFGTLAVVIGAVLLAVPVGEALVGPIGHFFQAPIAEWMVSSNPAEGLQYFTQEFNWGDPATRDLLLQPALSCLGLPAFVSGILVDIGLFDSMLNGVGTVALVDVLPAGFTAIILRLVAFLILLIAFAIVLHIIKKFLTNLTEIRLFGGINKILGFLFALVQAYLIVSVLLVLVSYIPMPGVLESVQIQIDMSYVTKMLAENNWIGDWLMNLIFG